MKPSLHQELAAVKAMLARMQDIEQLITISHDDVRSAANSIRAANVSSAMAYVRSVFGMVEGSISAMSSLLLEGRRVWDWSLSDDEVRILWDAVPEPGCERPSGGRATLTERTKAIFKIGRRLFGPHCRTDYGGVPYRSFREALAIRDRLMHPKKGSDLSITPRELGMVDVGRDWFRAHAKAFFEAGLLQLRERYPEASRRVT
jgi:hypothetical protein